MKIKRTGFILYVINYKETIEFYRDVLELDILFKNETLTCFDLFGTYLMVEIDDRSEYLNLKRDHLKAFSCIRLNVVNVKEIANDLKSKNIEVNYQEHTWGTVAKFFDPDGNLLAFRDEETFIKQMEEYISKSK